MNLQRAPCGVMTTPVEAVYVFPTPESAAVDGFAAQMGERRSAKMDVAMTSPHELNEEDVYALMLTQQTDGSSRFSNLLEKLTTAEAWAHAHAHASSVGDAIAATEPAIEVLTHHAASWRSQWELTVHKAQRWLNQQPQYVSSSRHWDGEEL